MKIVTQNLERCSSLYFPDAAFDVVAIATSAGGLKALSQILLALPADFPVAITIVQHLDPLHHSLLVPILSRRTKLIVKQAKAGEQLQSGTVYIAPPDWHLLVNPDGAIALTQTERVNFTRPAADLLFESVANSFKQRAIAVVLTGMGRDGAAGIKKVKQMGGTTIAQDKNTAEFRSMPNAAIQTQAVDLILPLNQIPLTLVNLVGIKTEES